jgi:hypothetical protein
MVSAVHVVQPPPGSRSPRRLMLPAAPALDAPRPPIPAHADARRAPPLIRQRALALHAAPPAFECRLTEMTVVARRAAPQLMAPSAHARRAAPQLILPTAHV